MPVRLDEVGGRDADSVWAKIEFMIVRAYIKDVLPANCLLGRGPAVSLCLSQAFFVLVVSLVL
jgi:hypothetical protein